MPIIKKKLKSWEKHERNTAEGMNGKVVPCSGRLPNNKGDVRADYPWGKLLVECKYTEKDSFSISKRLWSKVEREALGQDRIPIMSVCVSGKTFIVVEKELFEDLAGGKNGISEKP